VIVSFLQHVSFLQRTSNKKIVAQLGLNEFLLLRFRNNRNSSFLNFLKTLIFIFPSIHCGAMAFGLAQKFAVQLGTPLAL